MSLLYYRSAHTRRSALVKPLIVGVTVVTGIGFRMIESAAGTFLLRFRGTGFKL